MPPSRRSTDALVVFHDHGCHWADPLLKRGFRHCFVTVADGPYWVEIDGLAGVPHVQVKCGTDFDLAGFYRGHEFTVVEVSIGESPPPGPLAVANCVGLVKTVIGLYAPLVFTPYQLYRRLEHDAARRKPFRQSQGRHSAASASAPDH